MNDDFIREVYETLNGNRTLTGGMPGVENAFAPGSLCDNLLKEVFDAERRLEARLGVSGEDEDVEQIISAMLNIQQEMCRCMYRYGAEFGTGEGI